MKVHKENILSFCNDRFKFCLFYEHIVQSHRNTCLLVSVCNWKPRRIPLKYKRPKEKG